MKQYADIHCHMLFGLDDGAGDMADMKDMLQAAYDDGTRLICFTPHYCPSRFAYDQAKLEQQCKLAAAYVRSTYPELHFFFGQEIFGDSDVFDHLQNGDCMTLSSTQYILIEFDPDVLYFTLDKTLERIQEMGYLPVLAHVERYRCLRFDAKRVARLVEKDILIQSNAAALSGTHGWRENRFIKQLLSAQLVHFASSDAHNLLGRRPELSMAYQNVSEKYGNQYADAIFYQNAAKLFGI